MVSFFVQSLLPSRQFLLIPSTGLLESWKWCKNHLLLFFGWWLMTSECLAIHHRWFPIAAFILLGNVKFVREQLILLAVYTSAGFRPNHIRKIEFVTVLKAIANLFPSKNNDDGMARFTIKKCPTGCEVNFVFLQRNNLMKLVDAKVKNGYRFRWGTFPRDKKDVQIFTLQYSLFKLWMVVTLLTMHPTLMLRIASTILSIIFTWW